MESDPYNDEDLDYKNTSLSFTIPIPSIDTCPKCTNNYWNRGQNYEEPSNYRDHQLPQNQFTAPKKIELPSQNVAFLTSNFIYEEGKPIPGLEMIVGPILEPDYDQFCIKELVEEARGKANPYEKVGESIFLNLSAMKLACLDSQISFTGVKRYDPVKDPVFWFADLCGGPGGFAEYLLWRKHSCGEKVFGWGITLTGSLDYDLDKFNPDSMVKKSFEPIYGEDGTGDLYKEENMNYFAKIVMEGTHGIGADLGFDIRGQESHQERLLKHLLLCQIITMFITLKKNGVFVLKVFEIFSPFTAGLIWILYRHFERICIIKPLPSRPANSESNMKIAIKQKEGLIELQKYIDNPDLETPDHNEYQRLCLQEWHIIINDEQ
ncbi:6739_t:CDS:10 [Diversispora eburnea]|uniref:Cap-specific mRNA (nucleoside-2'-O-)-methyltransferase 1 n=1 Tax=Diversispora eburnea TaxID=1213867 RepID=A0A9N8YWA5_9GLOM|nr:6739_t:CDS:10 [Diversispora eburnea]